MKKNEARNKSTAPVKSDGNGVEKSYAAWIADLKRRYRAMQIKAAVAVNSAMLEFYWTLGRDISDKYPGKKRNAGFYEKLSVDLCLGIPDSKGLSPTNIKYARYFYELYSYRQQLVADNDSGNYRQQLADDNEVLDLMKIPWGHHIVIIGKSKGDSDKALFYVRRTIQNGWSRNSLLNWLSTDLYEREGKWVAAA